MVLSLRGGESSRVWTERRTGGVALYQRADHHYRGLQATHGDCGGWSSNHVKDTTMRALTLAASSAALTIVPALASAQAQGQANVSDLRCSDISLLPIANQAALIYYAAGYRDGVSSS